MAPPKSSKKRARPSQPQRKPARKPTSTARRRSARIGAASLHKPSPGAPQDSLLLDLPPELRNRIYEFALVDADNIFVQKNRDRLLPRFGPSEPPLLKACRQTREEGTEVYYGGNRFVSSGGWDMVHWMQFLGEKKYDMLRWIAPERSGAANVGDTPARIMAGMCMFDIIVFCEGVVLRDDVWRRGCTIDGVVQYLCKSELKARMSEKEISDVEAGEEEMMRAVGLLPED